MNGYIRKYNLHTHSFYCGHGHGTIAEYAEEGRRLGLDLLGFSEHCPRPDGRFKRSRMASESMVLYEADCRREAGKGGLAILAGYECDYSPKHQDYYRELLASGRADYLITGTHFIPLKDGSGFVSPFTGTLADEDVITYRDMLISAMDSGLFSFVAHPDLYLAGYAEFNRLASETARIICRHAAELGLPLEVNGNGFLKPPVDGRYAYPVEDFWRIAAEESVRCIYNTDAHEVENLGRTRSLLEDFIARVGVELTFPSVVDGQLSFV